MSKIQVYCAVSLDGFIAGPEDDLSWLGEPPPEQTCDPGTISFEVFLEQTGTLIMGRRTFDVVMGFGGDWPYGSIPVLIATTRPLLDVPASVSTCKGNIKDLCEQAKQMAGDKNVYLDGGNLITQALDAGSVEEMILTAIPVLLGQGVSLYQGKQIHHFNSKYLGKLGTMMQTKFTNVE
ncbi:Dihydrofolate reductase [Desulfocicer vacuolatum DSM 3385]|uniref:Dihydrofolate reductase n=1 Tax=Desulfocicer vacuolatum DSM 3385 TaxID=1121400 RepID=A0A1W2DVL7_9BACT|nr:dihydrofolate reductase family protein [Desulfocicer vacuolatum]SMD01565.1 Dihydrofolate reductase [Desulfocicer vacuolatum DSM 3385]